MVTIEVSKYVKLHFVRSLSCPNLDAIRSIEAEYFATVFPRFPKILPGGPLIIFWYPILPFYYFKSYRPKLEKAKTDLAAAIDRQSSLMAQVEKLTAISAV